MQTTKRRQHTAKSPSTSAKTASTNGNSRTGPTSSAVAVVFPRADAVAISTAKVTGTSTMPSPAVTVRAKKTHHVLAGLPYGNHDLAYESTGLSYENHDLSEHDGRPGQLGNGGHEQHHGPHVGGRPPGCTSSRR
ncbi:hypothetical protein ACIBWG_31960 [Streptomyces griseoaurantiacus]|uniref:hypothetical protein n=1 Tax=Streptomyces TaxID=1883 RepID=UPI0029A25308|nr:hypothetical protein [Streptomyces sp. ME02-6978.2a]MDX3364108.1 hypothetical protein [Streptomyces sp. ME02-6978.2a]